MRTATEHAAEAVLDLERAEGALANASGEVEVKARLCKNRHGVLQRFTEL